MASADLDNVANTGAQDLLGSARTVTGNNIQGTARIVSLSELQHLMSTLLKKHSGASEDELKAREDQIRQELEGKIAALQNRIAELEGQLGQGEQEKAAAVAAAQQELQGRIKELENILANDDARARCAFLEQEVARLQALIDRYEVGLEIITAIDHADNTAAISLAKELQGRASGELASRLAYIAEKLEHGGHALGESLKAVNDQGAGHVYAVLDLVELATALRHLRHEVTSISQALG